MAYIFRRSALSATRGPLYHGPVIPVRRTPPQCLRYPNAPRLHQRKHFSTSGKRAEGGRQESHRKESFGRRLNKALGNTRIEWKPIPIGLGIAVLCVFQFYRVQQREKRKQEEEAENNGPVPKRKRITPSGPWTVKVMSTLPLKFLSRLWGKFNEIDLPYSLRIPGFKLYGYIFGVNFDEISEPDLHVYPNLAAFFYRTLKPGVRPIDPDSNAIVSPADGKIIQFGAIEHGEVEQVKGVTYSLDALLGSKEPTSPLGESNTSPQSNMAVSPKSPQPSNDRHANDNEEVIRADEEFANVNGISYTLPNLFSGDTKSSRRGFFWQRKPATDQSIPGHSSSEAEVARDFALRKPESAPWWAPWTEPGTTPTQLYYCVIYLAPGDYHRFHSPVSWVVQSRRHFAGELYSVSPYLQRTLPGLFTLNERVVLLGRWRWGFFSYTPVGATNVGSIKINFDRELRTNSLTTDTEADRAAAEAKKRGEPYSGFAEATYENASPILHGHALKKGEEMGGFQLGSTIVLVFEAPKGRRPTFDEGFGERKGGWKWRIEPGQKVKVGQALGSVIEERAPGT